MCSWATCAAAFWPEAFGYLRLLAGQRQHRRGHACGRLALAVLELLVGVWLDQRVAVPFAVASQS
jgi:hypothetical protein